MSKMKLQLVTVDLDNGQRGMFIGLPLITDELADVECQVEDIWFSDVQALPGGMSLSQAIEMIYEQLGCRQPRLQ